MTVYQIDDITQLYYDAATQTDANEFLDPSNTFFAPGSVNWTLRNAAAELASKDAQSMYKEYTPAKMYSHIGMLYKHTISESAPAISSIMAEFTGFAIFTQHPNFPREVRFYVWNFTTNQWDRIGIKDINALSDQDWTDNISSGFSNYVDGANTIYFMAYTYQGVQLLTPSGLHDNYWKITVTPLPPPSTTGRYFFQGAKP